MASQKAADKDSTLQSQVLQYQNHNNALAKTLQNKNKEEIPQDFVER